MAKRKSFAAGVVILTAAGLAVRLLGFVYRVFLSNTIGAEGMGLFQLIVPIYTLIVLTLTSGISIAVSRITAAELSINRNANLHRISNYAALLVFVLGSVASGLLYLNIQAIAENILKDTRTYYSLFMMVPAIPLIAVASAIKGYFYGCNRMTPTAVSQIIEQVVKMLVVIMLAGTVVPLGLEFACALATFGMIAGELASLIFLLPVYLSARKKRYTSVKSRTALIIELLKNAVPISANRFLVSLMSAAEFLLIPTMLVLSGLHYKESLIIYGKLSGMVLPLITFPSIVTFSLATTLVPAISEASSLNNRRSLNYRAGKSIQLTFVLGVAFTCLYMAFPHEISSLVYKKQDVGYLLFLLSFSCTFIYLQQVLTGILNGLGKQVLLLRNTIIGSAVRIGAVVFLTPRFGIESYILGLTASYILTDILNLSAINRDTGLIIDIRNWITKPAVAGLAMILISKAVFALTGDFLSLLLPRFGTAVFTGGAAGLIILMLLKVISIDEIMGRLAIRRKR